MPKIRIRVRPIAGEAPNITPDSNGTDKSSLPDMGKALLGGGLLVGGALLARKPSLIGKAANVINSARLQSMLSGLAVPKQILGGVGAAGIASAERGTMEPLKQLFSRQTLKDIGSAWKRNTPYPGAAKTPGWLPTPGRAIQSIDEGVSSALQRAGLSSEEAARELLQAPLTGSMGKALDSPAARYLIPFRRTPFNQFIEGLETMKGEHPRVLAAVGAAGGVHGAATSDDRYPLTLGLGAAAAGRYALPYSLAALMGRYAAGGRTDAGIAGAVLPVSEYGLTTGIEDPLQPFRRPAALTALERMTGRR